MSTDKTQHDSLEKRQFSFFPVFVKVSLMSVSLIVIGYFKCQLMEKNDAPPKRPDITIPASR